MTNHASTGPFRFRLIRTTDETGTSGTGHVADGVQFQDGTCVLRWRTRDSSTAVYRSHDALMRIHGHNGATACEWIDAVPGEAFRLGEQNLLQDGMENAPFASIGGLDCRAAPTRPHWVTAADWSEYLRGYEAAALAQYGDDWRTCSFGWAPAVTIGGAR